MSFLLACSSCAHPTYTTRPIKDEPSLFVGLASDTTSGEIASHNHPREWSDTELRTIMGQLLIQQQGGIMDPRKQAQAVFSTDDIDLLTPALREGFKIARPSDWVVFALWSSSQVSQALEVTSGGMFLQDQRFHIILANHRERVSSEEVGIKDIRSNPFRSLRDIKKGKLSFDPNRYVIESRDHWTAGGYNAPSSELVLDLKGLLATDHFSALRDSERQTATENSRIDSLPALATESEVGALKEEISNLKDELSRLQKLISQQADKDTQRKNP